MSYACQPSALCRGDKVRQRGTARCRRCRAAERTVRQRASQQRASPLKILLPLYYIVARPARRARAARWRYTRARAGALRRYVVLRAKKIWRNALRYRRARARARRRAYDGIYMLRARRRRGVRAPRGSARAAASRRYGAGCQQPAAAVPYAGSCAARALQQQRALAWRIRGDAAERSTRRCCAPMVYEML